jgi:hypothetical protein
MVGGGRHVPRCALVRIATGRDAADTAFLTSNNDSVRLVDVAVCAVTASALPGDDLTQPTYLG